MAHSLACGMRQLFLYDPLLAGVHGSFPAEGEETAVESNAMIGLVGADFWKL